jgi:cation:H+ antiporter
MAGVLMQFAVAAAVIVVAGTYLSRFADEIAERTGLGRLLIGSVLLAGATSLPELSVDISAIRNGMPDLAVGDLMGSSMFNLLILAILDLSTHSRGWMLSRLAARHALSGGMSAALTAVVVLGLLGQPILGSGEFLHISYGFWFVVAGYIMGVRMVYIDQLASRDEARVADGEPPHEKQSWWRPAVGFVAAAGVIVVAGPFLSDAAGKIAEATGLGTTFVGTTLVAFSTSLPEFVASLAAIRMGAHDLAIGNFFGSNAFNMLLLMPLDLVQPGPLLGVVSPAHAITGVAAILVTLIAMLGQLYHAERRRRVIEPDAWLMLLTILGAIWLVYSLGTMAH